ncbi:MAG: arsenate reductase ArsC [Acidobacteria bacterium]|nr:arsenate reductase ArsC [Acidobacteriota bacterium]
MAEALLRHLAGDHFDAASAGTHPTGLHPLAIEVMRELGIDISRHRSKKADEFAGQRFDYVITVCDPAREACPLFPGAGRMLHWSFDDPAAAEGSREERLAVFRRVRDEITDQMRRFVLDTITEHG